MDPALPEVAFVLVNYNGEKHLASILTSIQALSYPATKMEVVVVDNASTDRSLDVIAHFPAVRVLRQRANIGFAAGCNVGAQSTTADLLAFVNIDMRLDVGWLAAMVGSYDPAGGYSCIASLILDWEGKHVDFGDGAINYHGMGAQIGFGIAFEHAAIEDGRELPFACGGAMLIDRKLFLGLGGFDASYFAFFEDVDLGWRIWLTGHRIRLAAGARCFHRHHGASAGVLTFQKTLALERNALRTLLKNLDDENLGRLLGPTLLLLVERARLASGSSRKEFEFGTRVERESERIDRRAVASLHAVGDVVADLEDLMEERRRVQQLRRVSDAEIFQRFGRPFQPQGSTEEPYLEAMTKVTQAFRLDRLFEKRRATRVLIIGYDVIGERMAGPGVRSWELAHALGRFAPVTLAFSAPIARSSSSIELASFKSLAELEALVHEADVVVYQGFSLEGQSFLRSTRALRVVDLYDPWIFEDLENVRSESPIVADWTVRRDVDVQQRLLSAGDFFVCASERQRDYWLGMLTAAGRVDRGTYQQDPTLRSLIDVVPYGCPDDPPHATERVLRGVVSGVEDDSFVILWSGGTWEWFDPLLVLEAFERVVAEEPRARLVFMGLELEGRGVPPQSVARQLRERAKELGRLGREVSLGEWVPYDERAAYLLEADVAVIAARSLAENRLAFRSRALDHFWAGVPTVTTGGDSLADLVEREQAGLVVPPGDVDAMSDALLRLMRDDAERTRIAAHAQALADRFRWSKVVEPLRSVIEEPWRWHALREARATPVAMTEDAQRLLAEWRGARSSVVRHRVRTSPTARRVWTSTPESAKRVLRPVVRRFLR